MDSSDSLVIYMLNKLWKNEIALSREQSDIMWELKETQEELEGNAISGQRRKQNKPKAAHRISNLYLPMWKFLCRVLNKIYSHILNW